MTTHRIYKLPPASHSDLAQKIREVLNASDDEDINFTIPQFHRSANEPPPMDPPNSNFTEWDFLYSLNANSLHTLGLRRWGEFNLWLFPGEWYDNIPNGYKVTDIFGKREIFQHGKTDDDIRLGCLSFGISSEQAAYADGDAARITEESERRKIEL